MEGGGGGGRCEGREREREGEREKPGKREEGGAKLQQDGHTRSAPADLSILPSIPVHNQTMAAFYLSLALVLLLSRPAPGQWWNLFWPQTSTLPPSISSISSFSSFTSFTSPPAAEETTEWFPKEQEESDGGSRSLQAGPSAPGQAAAGRSRSRPLKRWKPGEYPAAPSGAALLGAAA